MGGGHSTPAPKAAEASAEVAPAAPHEAEHHQHSAIIRSLVNNHSAHVNVSVEDGVKMDKGDLRLMYESVPDKLFEAAYHMFDWEATGEEALMEVRMFSMIMVTLCTPSHASSDSNMVEIAFEIFDADKSGSLEKSEFAAMLHVMYTSRNSALKLIFESESGHEMLREFASKEHAVENLDFLDAVKVYEAEPTPAGAKDIMVKYIGPTAESEVNISGKQVKEIKKAWEAAGGDACQTAPADIFQKAKAEILKMVEKDTFVRFNKDQSVMQELADKLFAELDTDGTGSISKDEYIKWAQTNPEAIKFYEQLKGLNKAV